MSDSLPTSWAGWLMEITRGHYPVNALPQAPPAHALPPAIADWVTDDQETATAWQGFVEEEGAADYLIFLDKLRNTVNRNDPAFRRSVIEKLRKAKENPSLRRLFFEQASAGIQSCQDRTTLIWNAMEACSLEQDVADGVYDHRIEELPELAASMFRLSVIAQIADEKVASLPPSSDAIQVYLAFQAKLRERLCLHMSAPGMAYGSDVTEEDLTAAEERVLREEEEIGLPNIISTKWAPWHSLATRLAPGDCEAAEDSIDDAIYPTAAKKEEVESRVREWLDTHRKKSNRGKEAEPAKRTLEAS